MLNSSSTTRSFVSADISSFSEWQAVLATMRELEARISMPYARRMTDKNSASQASAIKGRVGGLWESGSHEGGDFNPLHREHR